MTIFFALPRQEELQLALKSLMAVATPLSLKKLPCQHAYACLRLTAPPAKQNRQFDWRFRKASPDSPAEVASSTCHQLANKSGGFPTTWALRSKLAIGNGGLAACPMHFTLKIAPYRK